MTLGLAPPRSGPVPRPPRRRRPVLRAVLAVLGVLALLVAVSIGRALTAPGTDSTSARLAEWGRGHGLSGAIDEAERLTYQAPAAGGQPTAGSPLSAEPSQPPTRALPRVLPRVQPFPAVALPDEGVWRVVETVRGRPALQETFLRPDAVHTSYTAALAWMDPTLLRFVLHPGTQEPGGSGWSTPTSLGADRTGLVAAFNSGFRLDASRGGFYEDGRTRGALRDGAASLVIDATGAAQVGQWGRDVRMDPGVQAVRQNLDLLVDGGQVVAGLADNSDGRWGRTLGNRLYVFRSGIGQTASGALVYAAGNGLSAGTLAELLARAGAVRAMELDINPEWTSFVHYPAESNLLPDMQRSPHRYDTASSRDFIAVLRRP